MGMKSTVRLLALLMALALALGASQSVWAQGKSQLPQIKQPTSERFDISGSVTSTGIGSSSSSGSSSNFTINITGTGAISGKNLEENITESGPANVQQPGTPSSFSLGFAIVDGRFYINLSGLTGGSTDQWYYFDVPPGTDTSMLNPAGSIIPSDPALAAAYTVTQVGKEDVNGVPATKYRIDVDYAKLLAAISAKTGRSPTTSPTPEPGLPDIHTDITSQIFIWVGDTDHYLYKVTDSESIKITSTGSTQLPEFNTALEITELFKDFDQKITITAPPNAKPLSQAGPNGSGSSTSPTFGGSGFLGSPLAGFGGGTMMPVGMLPGMPSSVSMPPTTVENPVVGMPRTGNSSTGGLWLLIATGLASVSAGVVIRRRTAESR